MRFIAAILALALAAFAARADTIDPADWNALLAAARGETVYFHAWGGEPRINDYIAWAGREAKERFGVTVVHVKVADTADTVAKLLAEKAAGRMEGGAVDLVWINGENFAAMKANGLLLPEPWATGLPNHALVDVEGKPTVTVDFTVPTDGLEAPWGMAKLVFFHDPARTGSPPRSIRELGEWIKAHPGRFTYPQPPDFLGTAFLKQALIELTPDREALRRPVEEADFARVTAPLFSWLDEVTPHLWRQGRAYPQDFGSLRGLFADGEVDIAF